MVARCAQEGLDVCRSALVVSRLPRAAYQCASAASDRSPGSGACRHHQACRRSYVAALLRHASPGAEDRYSDNPGFIRSHGILPANTRRKPRSTTRTIRNSVRLSSSEGVSSRTTSKWQSSYSPRARLPACLRGCSPNRLHNTEYANPQRFHLHFCSLCVSKSMRS